MMSERGREREGEGEFCGEDQCREQHVHVTNLKILPGTLVGMVNKILEYLIQ